MVCLCLSRSGLADQLVQSSTPEAIYTMLNTAYGTKRWLVPGFLQGTPDRFVKH